MHFLMFLLSAHMQSIHSLLGDLYMEVERRPSHDFNAIDMKTFLTNLKEEISGLDFYTDSNMAESIRSETLFRKWRIQNQKYLEDSKNIAAKPQKVITTPEKREPDDPVQIQREPKTLNQEAPENKEQGTGIKEEVKQSSPSMQQAHRYNQAIEDVDLPQRTPETIIREEAKNEKPVNVPEIEQAPTVEIPTKEVLAPKFKKEEEKPYSTDIPMDVLAASPDLAPEIKPQHIAAKLDEATKPSTPTKEGSKMQPKEEDIRNEKKPMQDIGEQRDPKGFIPTLEHSKLEAAIPMVPYNTSTVEYMEKQDTALKKEEEQPEQKIPTVETQISIPSDPVSPNKMENAPNKQNIYQICDILVDSKEVKDRYQDKMHFLAEPGDVLPEPAQLLDIFLEMLYKFLEKNEIIKNFIAEHSKKDGCVVLKKIANWDRQIYPVLRGLDYFFNDVLSMAFFRFCSALCLMIDMELPTKDSQLGDIFPIKVLMLTVNSSSTEKVIQEKLATVLKSRSRNKQFVLVCLSYISKGFKTDSVQTWNHVRNSLPKEINLRTNFFKWEKLSCIALFALEKGLNTKKFYLFILKKGVCTEIHSFTPGSSKPLNPNMYDEIKKNIIIMGAIYT